VSGARPGTGLPPPHVPGWWRKLGWRALSLGCVCVLNRPCAMMIRFVCFCSVAERTSMIPTIPTSSAGAMGSSSSSSTRVARSGSVHRGSTRSAQRTAA